MIIKTVRQYMTSLFVLLWMVKILTGVKKNYPSFSTSCDKNETECSEGKLNKNI